MDLCILTINFLCDFIFKFNIRIGIIKIAFNDTNALISDLVIKPIHMCILDHFCLEVFMTHCSFLQGTDHFLNKRVCHLLIPIPPINGFISENADYSTFSSIPTK